jgi:hypothetical protein
VPRLFHGASPLAQAGRQQRCDEFNVATVTHSIRSTSLQAANCPETSDTRILTIGVVYQCPVLARLASVQCLFKCIQNEVRGHRVADSPPRTIAGMSGTLAVLRPARGVPHRTNKLRALTDPFLI